MPSTSIQAKAVSTDHRDWGSDARAFFFHVHHEAPATRRSNPLLALTKCDLVQEPLLELNMVKAVQLLRSFHGSLR